MNPLSAFRFFKHLRKTEPYFLLSYKWLHLCFSWIKKGCWCFLQSECIIRYVKFFFHPLCLEKWELCCFCVLVLSSFLVSILYFTFGDQTLAVVQLSLWEICWHSTAFSKQTWSFTGLNPKEDVYYKMKPHEIPF